MVVAQLLLVDVVGTVQAPHAPARAVQCWQQLLVAVAVAASEMQVLEVRVCTTAQPAPSSAPRVLR